MLLSFVLKDKVNNLKYTIKLKRYLVYRQNFREKLYLIPKCMKKVNTQAYKFNQGKYFLMPTLIS
jgi:hypothetical protein